MNGEEDDGVDGAQVAWTLERLARLMRARGHEDGLNPAQWEALRYLARANRFSASPGALTRFLGATKGTVSQTVIALERKGYVSKLGRGAGRKTATLTLTEKGRHSLSQDPWSGLATAAGELGGKTRRRLQRGLEELLSHEVRRAGLASFGTCASCRFFREKGRDGHATGPHLCMLFEDALSEVESTLICAEHAPAG